MNKNIGPLANNLLLLIIIVLLPVKSLFALDTDAWVNAINNSKFSRNNSVVNNFSNEYDLLFVYSSTCGYCHKFAPVLKEFIEDNSIIAHSITSDGGYLPGFEKAKYDPVKLQSLQIQAYPSLFAINKDNGSAIMLSQGFLSRNDLNSNFKALLNYLYEGAA